MDLDNMRAHGVRAIVAACYCGRSAIVDVSALPGAITVPSLQGRLRCASCGARPMDVRPNWIERVRPGSGMGC